MRQLILILLISIITASDLCNSSKDNTSTQTNVIQSENKDLKNSLKNKVCPDNFKNFTYQSAFSDKGVFTLKDGELEPSRNADGLVYGIGYSLASEYYGDLVGDEKKEAVVTLSVTTGGSAIPNVLYVFDMSEKNPKLLWTFISGDRADEGLRNVYTIEKELVIETYEPKDAKGACCPKSYTATTYSWKKNRFVEVEKKTNIPNPDTNASFVGTDSPCE